MDFTCVNEYTMNFIKSESLGKLLKFYKRLRLKYSLTNKNIWFNKVCKERNVFPPYINNIFNRNSRLRTENKFTVCQYLLRSELRRLYSVRDAICTYMYVVHSNLTFYLSPVEFDAFDYCVRDWVSNKLATKQLKLDRKLSRLFNSQTPTNSTNNDSTAVHTFAPRTMFLCNDGLFDNEEIQFLNKGLKYVPKGHMDKGQVHELAVDLELIEGLSAETKRQCAVSVASQLRKSLHRPSPLLKSIKDKVTENNLIIVGSDKGSSTVVMNTDAYISKCEDFILTNGGVLLNKNPVRDHAKLTRTTIENCQEFFKNKTDRDLAKVMNPRTPLFYGLPKLHKQGHPMRPITSGIGSATSKIAVKLNKEIRRVTGFQAKFSIKNSIELVEKTKSLELTEGSKLISFDVVSLFTSVPTGDCLELYDALFKRSGISPILHQEMFNLLSVCFKQNFFKFNNKFYKMEGLPMGSPLSPLSAEVFMDNLECLISRNPLYKKHVKSWMRYVDDILVVWEGSLEELGTFERFMNTLHQNIKFTTEIGDKEINFLDLNLKVVGNRLQYSIYRKPTATDTLIPADSQHPWSQKMSGFHWLVSRLLKVPLSQEDYEKERAVIKLLASRNGYDPAVIDKIIYKKKRRATIDEVYNDSTSEVTGRKWCSLTYTGPEAEKLGGLIRNEGFQVAYKPPMNLKKMLSRPKDKIPTLEKSGVYSITCGSCPATYVGKTGRSLAVRINEHKPTSSKASHMKDHVRRAGHQFSDENVRLLHAIDEGPRLYAYEKLEIMKCKKRRGDMCLNVQSDFHSEVFEVVVDEEQRATGGVTRRERGEVRSPRHNPEVQLVAASQPQYASDSLRGGAAL